MNAYETFDDSVFDDLFMLLFHGPCFSFLLGLSFRFAHVEIS